MNKKGIQSNAKHISLQLVFIKNAMDKKKQASKKQFMNIYYTIAHPAPVKHTVLSAHFSCKMFC